MPLGSVYGLDRQIAPSCQLVAVAGRKAARGDRRLMAEGCRKPTGRTLALQVRGSPLRRWGPRNSRAPTDCCLAAPRPASPALPGRIGYALTL